MRYRELAVVYDEMSKTTKRLEKIDLLAHFLKKVPSAEKDVMYLLLGDIYPEYDERRIGISNQLAVKAIAKAVGIDQSKVVKEWKSLGDLGEVAKKLIHSKKQSTLHSQGHLTLEKVLLNLRKLPTLEGKGSINKKMGLITELLISADPLEALYLVRTLIGDLRIGVQESTVREAMAQAFFKRDSDVSRKIQEAIDNSNDLAVVFEIAKKKKIDDFTKVALQIGKPIKAMLAQKAATMEEGFKMVNSPCAVEYKYDGFRLFIHKRNKEVLLFTRRLENVTKQFPEVVSYIQKSVKGHSFILDSEAVGYDRKTKRYTTFQAISQRIRRKYNIEEMEKTLPVEINVFDILYYNGKSLLEEPFKKRSDLIRKIIHKHPYKIIPSKQIITKDISKAKEFYRKALKDNQEGVMLKNLVAPYQPGRRVGNMLKIKPEEKDLDLVITGAEYGKGKRSGWLSSFILSCRDGKKFLPIGKVGTGVKEKSADGISFEELTKKLTPYITEEKGRKVIVKPKVVVSVGYQEIQHSPNYPSGFALRFPRFTALREDRAPHDISTLEEVEQDFEHQKRNYTYG